MYNKKLNLLKLFQVVLADEHLFRHDTWESLITHVTHPRLNAMRGCIRKTMKDGQARNILAFIILLFITERPQITHRLFRARSPLAETVNALISFVHILATLRVHLNQLCPVYTRKCFVNFPLLSFLITYLLRPKMRAEICLRGKRQGG